MNPIYKEEKEKKKKKVGREALPSEIEEERQLATSFEYIKNNPYLEKTIAPDTTKTLFDNKENDGIGVINALIKKEHEKELMGKTYDSELDVQMAHEEYHPYIRKCAAPFKNPAQLGRVIKKDIIELNVIFKQFRLKQPMFDGQYPVPNIRECRRIIESGNVAEKMALSIGLEFALNAEPAIFIENPLMQPDVGEKFSPSYEKMKRLRENVNLQIFGEDRTYGTRRLISASDLDIMKPKKEESMAILRMLTSFSLTKCLERANFFKQEMKTLGKTYDQLTKDEKTEIMVKSTLAGMETKFAFTKGVMSNLKGPMKEAYEVIKNHVDNLDAINEETEIFSTFKDVKLSDAKNKEELEQHINGVRGKYRKMGLYGTEFANSLMEKLGEGKKLTKASENASGNEEFSKNIIKPLEKVIRLSPLDDNNKPQSGYETALKDLINSLIKYKDGNKGISDSDKAMFMYASALVDLINEKGR